MSDLGYDLRGLEVFASVCELRSMTLAAQRLGLSQPAVSQAVQQLEQTLRVTLLHRGRRPLAVTSAGEWLARRAARILRDAHQIATTIRQLEEGSALPLRVGVVESLSDPFVPALVRQLQSSVLYLSISAGLARELRAGLLDHSFDLVITNDSTDDADELDRLALLTETYVLVVPRSLEIGAPTLAALGEALPLVRWHARSHIGADIERQLRRMRVELRLQFEFDSSRTILGMVAAGLGWAIMPPLALCEMKPLPRSVRLLPFPGPSFSRSIAIVARRGEVNPLGARIARTAARILRDLYVPEIREAMPWLPADGFRVEEAAGSG
jgi:DNA-binding transcriptional LysR family regulator